MPAIYRRTATLLICAICAIILLNIISVKASIQENQFAITIGGPGEEEGYAIRQTSDGGFILAGQTDSLGLGQDMLVVKTDASGQIVWQRTYGTDGYDSAFHISVTSAGQYFVAGSSSSGPWILKLDQAGGVLWQKEYLTSDTAAANSAYSLTPTSTGGLIVVGSTASSPQYLWALELTADGSLAWQKKYQYQETRFFGAPKVLKVADGLLLATDTSAGPFDNGNNLLMLKLSNTGDIVWQNIYADAFPNTGAIPLQQSDGGYIIASEHYEGFYLMKIDSLGNVVWQRKHTVDASVIVNGIRTLHETADGGFVAFGSVRPGPVKMWLIKFDATGTLEWQRVLGRYRDGFWAPQHPGSSQNGRSIQILDDGGFIAVGTTDLFGAGDNRDILLLRLDSQGQIQDCCIEEPSVPFTVSPTYLVTVDSNILSSDLTLNVQDTAAFVVTPSFASHYVCCGEADLSIRQDDVRIPDGGQYDFGPLLPGTSTTVTFWFENNGDEDIGVGPIQVNPSGAFSTTAELLSIPPNSARSLEITFSPSTLGPVEAEIILFNSDCDESPYSFNLTGTGYKPTWSVLLPVMIGDTMTTGSAPISAVTPDSIRP